MRLAAADFPIALPTSRPLASLAELIPLVREDGWSRAARNLRERGGERAAFRFCRHMACLREKAGDLEEARRIHLHILDALAPEHGPTRIRLHEVERRLHVRRLRSAAPAARRRGDHERALRQYLQLMALEPDEGFHALHAADCLARLDRHADALDHYREAAARFRARGFERRARAVDRLVGQLSG